MPEVVSLPGTLGEAVALLASADSKLEKGASLGHRKLLTVCSMLRGVISFYQSAAAAVSASPVPGVGISIGPDCLETPPVILQISIASEGVGVGGAILSTHYQPTSVLSADCETQVSLVDLGSDVFTQTAFIPQNLPRTPLARAEPREHARTIVQREVIHRYLDSRPAGSFAAGATAFQSPDDFSTDHVDALCGSVDDQDDSQNPPGYWDESDFEGENDGSQNPPGYWDESDFSEEEYFSESAVSLPHLGVSHSDAPLEPGVDSFEEPADDSPLGESNISDNYEQSEAWDDEANDDYETAEGFFFFFVKAVIKLTVPHTSRYPAVVVFGMLTSYTKHSITLHMNSNKCWEQHVFVARKIRSGFRMLDGSCERG
ncbi:hypothetical protein CYMTET_20261 [Cymbomonas tetramitiformis]|uniref:Uncharacterized protein n=1 Tax=Cymbomonas tetramitiformis TaxID=36881 RepID=A0AAE0L4E0_9CHLO|nr:hypothetical protein CYMTET_20261 [Cymbomonas tetramitiformis]